MITRCGRTGFMHSWAVALPFAALAAAGPALAQADLCKAGQGCRLAIPSTGLYMGIQAYPYITDSAEQICTDQQCSIQVREGAARLGIDRRFALHLHYAEWTTLESELAADPGCTKSDSASEICSDVPNGRVPVISWACDGSTPPQGFHSTDTLIADINLAETKSIDCDQPTSGWQQEYCTVKKTADLLKQYPGPVLLRWFWEFNLLENNQNCRGNDNPPTAGDYTEFKDAWQRIWTIFQNEKATNVMFLWNPGQYAPGGHTDPHNYYPGNLYVDWLGIDTYQRSSADVFADNIQPFYGDFSKPAYAGKPLMVGENGSPNYAMQNEEIQEKYLGADPNGLLADFQSKRYPKLKAYDYFDSDNFNKDKRQFDSWVLDPPSTYMISSISESGNVVTVVLITASGLKAGALFTVAGVSPTKYNGVNFRVQTSSNKGMTLTYVDEAGKGLKPGTGGRIEISSCTTGCGGVAALAALADSAAFNAIPSSSASNPAARMACSVSAKLLSVVYGYATIQVNTASPTGHAASAANCPWSVGPLPSWLQLESPAQGVGPGTITLLVSPSAAVQKATIEIGGAFVTITQ